MKLFFWAIIYTCTFARLHLLSLRSFLHTPAFFAKKCMQSSPERKSKFTTTNAWMWLRRNRRKCRVEWLRFCIWNLVFLFIRRNSFSLKYNATWGVIQPPANNLKMEAALIAGLHLCHAKQWFDFGIYECYYWYLIIGKICLCKQNYGIAITDQNM